LVIFIIIKKILFIPIGKVIFFLLKSRMLSIIFCFSSSEICDKNLHITKFWVGALSWEKCNYLKLPLFKYIKQSFLLILSNQPKNKQNLALCQKPIIIKLKSEQ